MNPEPKLKEKAEEIIINLDDDDDDADDSDVDVGGHGFLFKTPTKPISLDHFTTSEEDRDLNLAILASLETTTTKTETETPNSVIDLSQQQVDKDACYYYIDDDDDDVVVLSSAPKKLKPNTGLTNPFDSRNSVREKGESSRSVPNSGSDPEFDCEICAESKPGVESFPIQGCTHVYCTDCVVRYIDSKLQENITNVRCPVSGCAGLLEPEFCRYILPVEMFDRWCVALSESVINESQRFYCPYKDCSALMIDDGEEVVRESHCPNCNRMFCAQCKVAWHEGISCEEFERLNKDEREKEDIMLMNLAVNKQWRRCPNCRFYVERTQGCSYMKCRCGTSFCYNCGTNQVSTTTHICHNCNGIPAPPMMPIMNLRHVRPVRMNRNAGPPNNMQAQAQFPQQPPNPQVQAQRQQLLQAQVLAQFHHQPNNIQAQAQFPQQPNHIQAQAQFPQQPNNVQAQFAYQPNNTFQAPLQAQFAQQPIFAQVHAQFRQLANNVQLHNIQVQQAQLRLHAQLQAQLQNNMRLQGQLFQQPNNIQVQAQFPQPANNFQVPTQFAEQADSNTV